MKKLIWIIEEDGVEKERHEIVLEQTQAPQPLPGVNPFKDIIFGDSSVITISTLPNWDVCNRCPQSKTQNRNCNCSLPYQSTTGTTVIKSDNVTYTVN